MSDADRVVAAHKLRREILGDDYVDAQTASRDPAMKDFQDYITSTAWGVWTREGLSPRDRSLCVMAMTAAMGRMDEFRLHASCTERTGVTDAELNELLFQVTAYCGAPAGINAMRAVRQVRAERDADR
jgi:4-carboxymuconolactone decarboxylase